jgi:hypothetical protein
MKKLINFLNNSKVVTIIIFLWLLAISIYLYYNDFNKEILQKDLNDTNASKSVRIERVE